MGWSKLNQGSDESDDGHKFLGPQNQSISTSTE